MKKQQSNPEPKFQMFMEQTRADKFDNSKPFVKLLCDIFGWVFLGCKESSCRTPFYILMLQLVAVRDALQKVAVLCLLAL